MIRRGEIYWVNLDPTVGAEIRKTRPALIVSNNKNNEFSDTVTVLPITSKADRIYPYEVRIGEGDGGLRTPGKIKANQIRTIDKRRLSSHPIGSPVGEELLDAVARAIKIHLDIY